MHLPPAPSLRFAAALALTLCGITIGGTTIGAANPAPSVVLGVNGHPLVSYPDIAFETQIDLVRRMGATAYRVDVTSDEAGAQDRFARLLDVAEARGVALLPVLIPPLSLDGATPEALRARAFAFASAYVGRFGARIATWELGNELENYAILRPCDRRADGSTYPCDWGPASGDHPSHYQPERWAKVSATLRGLSDGARAADPAARRAIGTAGWGHFGAFDLLARDGVAWDVSVWHVYVERGLDAALARLARHGKPIWITEFNGERGSAVGLDTQAERLGALSRRILELAKQNRVEAAFVYELLDERYWTGDESVMGLWTLEKGDDGRWRVGDAKPALAALRRAFGLEAPK